MPHSVACVQCGHVLTLSEDIYERKVAGKLVTIKCKHCSGSLSLDARGPSLVVTAATPRTLEAPKSVTSARSTMVGVPLAPVAPVAAAPPPALDDVPPPPARPAPPARPGSSPGESASAAEAAAPSPPPLPPPRRTAPSAPSAEALPPPRSPAPSSSDVVTSVAPDLPLSVPSAAIASHPASAEEASALSASINEALASAPSSPAETFNPFTPPVSSPLAGASSPFGGAPPSSPFGGQPAGAAPFASPPASSPFVQPGAPSGAAPSPYGIAAASAGPVFEAAPLGGPSASGASPDVETPSLRDPHAEFRRGARRPLVFAVLGIAAAVGGAVYFNSKQPAVVPSPASRAEPERRPVIGASVAPYRADADEVVPGAGPAPLQLTEKKSSSSDEPVRPQSVGSSKDFAEIFKAKASAQSE